MKIAYVTTSFGSLSHTFIRREISELKSLGVDVSLYGVRPEISKELSSKDKNLIKSTLYTYPLRPIGVLNANLWFLFNKPINYLKATITALFNEESSLWKHLILIYHFFLSSYIALDMRENKIEHIHAHFMNVSSTIAMFCSELLNLPFSITVHSAGIKSLREMTGLKQKLKESKFICSISNYNKRYINKIYPCKNKTYVVRAPGVDPSKHYSRVNHIDLLNEDSLELLAVGRLVEKKGFEYLIKAANILKKDNMHFRLNIIGEGPLKHDLERLVEELNLSNGVFLKGSCSSEKVKRAYDNADITVVPSVVSSTGEMEGIPVVIMESMILGVPVIATKHSGIPEIIKEKETGLLIPEKNPEAIARAIKRLAKDRKLRKICIENGKKLVNEEYNVKNVAKFKKKLFNTKLLDSKSCFK